MLPTETSQPASNVQQRTSKHIYWYDNWIVLNLIYTDPFTRGWNWQCDDNDVDDALSLRSEDVKFRFLLKDSLFNPARAHHHSCIRCISKLFFQLHLLKENVNAKWCAMYGDVTEDWKRSPSVDKQISTSSQSKREKRKERNSCCHGANNMKVSTNSSS